MNRSILAAIALVIPAVLFADVKVNVSATINATPDVVFVDEPWFEDVRCDNDSKASFEYQWVNNHGTRVLNYRQVTFAPFTGAWVFGPWMIHQGIYAARHHVNRAPHWVREFSHYDRHHVPQYRYSYRDDRINHSAHATVNRYEYRSEPQHSYRGHNDKVVVEKTVVTEHRSEPRQYGDRQHNDRNWNERNNNRGHENHRNDMNCNAPLIKVTQRETRR